MQQYCPWQLAECKRDERHAATAHAATDLELTIFTELGT